MDKNRMHKPDDPSKKIVRSRSFDPYWSSKRLSEEETVGHPLTDEDTNVERGRQFEEGSQRRRARSFDDSWKAKSLFGDKKEKAIEEASERQIKIAEEKLEMSKRLGVIESGLHRLRIFEEKYEEYKKLKASAEDEIARARMKCKDLREQISKEEHLEKERQTQLQEKRKEITKTSNDLKSLKEQLETQERELGEMEKQKETLQRNIEIEREKLKEMLPGDLSVDEYIKKLETLLSELSVMETLEIKKSDLELKEVRNESEFYDLDKSRNDLKGKKEEKEHELLELQKHMENSFGVKEKCNQMMDKIAEDKEYLRKLSESDQYEDYLEKIYIIGVLRPGTISYDLQALLKNEETNLVNQEDRKKMLDISTNLYGNASTAVDGYNLRSKLKSRLEAKQKESTNIPKFEIEDISAYNDLKGEYDRLVESHQDDESMRDYGDKLGALAKNYKDYELVRGSGTQDEKQYKDNARAFVELSLERFINTGKIAKMLESMIEFNEAENSRILSKISLPEGGSVKQRINALFEQEVPQNQNLEVRRGELLNLFNKVVEGEKARIENIVKEEGMIRSFLEENKKSINIVEGEIDEKISRRKEIKQDLEIKEREIVELEREQQTSQTDLKDRKKEIQKLKSQIKDIEDQKKAIGVLDKQYQESEDHCQKRQSEIKETKRQLNKMRRDLRRARGRIASIEAKCKGHTQTMSKLYREQQAHQRERHNALKDSKCYNQRIEWIELFRQQIRYIEDRREKLLPSIKQLQDNYDELQKRKHDIENLSIDDHQGRSELGI